MSIQRAIDTLSNPDVAIDHALRSVLIVGNRIKSEAIEKWVNLELFGYSDTDQVPAYRHLDQNELRIEILFSGPQGREFTHSLGFADLPDQLQMNKKGLDLKQPARSLARLAESDSKTKAAMPMPTQWCGAFNYLSGQGEITFQAPFFQAVSANILLDKGLIDDAVSAVRTSALKLLLELEQVAPNVGEPGGPTVDSDERLEGISLTVGQMTGSLFVTIGSGNSISAQYAEGDLTAIYEKAADYLAPEGVEQLKEALSADGGQPGKKTGQFVQRVKDGAVSLAGGVAASGAYDGLCALLQITP